MAPPPGPGLRPAPAHRCPANGAGGRGFRRKRGAERRVRPAGPGAAAMLDFFTIFSKGGLVLWCFQGVRGPAATAPVNALIRSVLLQVGRDRLLGGVGLGRGHLPGERGVGELWREGEGQWEPSAWGGRRGDTTDMAGKAGMAPSAWEGKSGEPT